MPDPYLFRSPLRMEQLPFAQRLGVEQSDTSVFAGGWEVLVEHRSHRGQR